LAGSMATQRDTGRSGERAPRRLDTRHVAGTTIPRAEDTRRP